MSDRTNLRACLRLCEEMAKRKGVSVAAAVVFSEYERFFKEHQALLDSLGIGKFREVVDKLVQDFKDREESLKAIGFNPVPIIIEATEPPDTFQAIKILGEGSRKAFSECKILYYSVSLQIPDGAGMDYAQLSRWFRPVRYIVVANEEEAEKLAVKSRLKVEQENAKEQRSGR